MFACGRLRSSCASPSVSDLTAALLALYAAFPLFGVCDAGCGMRDAGCAVRGAGYVIWQTADGAYMSAQRRHADAALTAGS